MTKIDELNSKYKEKLIKGDKSYSLDIFYEAKNKLLKPAELPQLPKGDIGLAPVLPTHDIVI